MSDKFIIDVIGVIKMSMQSVTRLVGIESNSEDFNGARGTRWRTSSAETQLKFCRTFLISGGFNTRECESEGKEERVTEILLMKNELKVFKKISDTIDHTILLSRLDDWFGVTGKALNWFKSYLTGRCQRIKIGYCLSSKADLKFGVPQGSVLGPLLFTLCTTPLSSMIFEHATPHHRYADDSQLYVSFASWDSAAALNGLQSCLASVQSWMSTNKLKLNPDRTEFLLIGNERQRSKCLSMFPIELLGVKTNPAKSARNLGVIFDTNFTFRSHISVVCNSCFYYMQDLRRIRRHLDLDSAKLLATALVSSRLDYCNSLLYGIAGIDLTRLQACTESTGSPGDKVSSIYSQYSTASFSSLVASKV